ncbi:hypothetical protein [Actinoplanes regularis]|uniref:hypothetical protein n=1 Tax=Actinoplanes regularis TaxID=52697 RepID=UPI000B7957FA|nr:hypothetical protein [Actinoplanes regularis]GIE92510.1 hypothetical protein Are01nite_89900 [Actinoplanes regularis]
MDRIISALVALVGLAIIIENQKFPDIAMTNSREVFGREIREGSREHRFTVIFSRLLAIFAGSAMLICGSLDALMIDWRGALLK